MRPAASARTVYRHWYAAAGPWAGFFRAVPLVALARGLAPPPAAPRASADVVAPPQESLAATLTLAGRREGWLGRPDVLLLLDLAGATSVAIAARLEAEGVRPVLLVFLWPEPGALVPADDLLTALLAHAPAAPSYPARNQEPAQYAFVLARERMGSASPADLALRFDNRYELGAVDLPDADRLRAGGIAAVVACRQAASLAAADLASYLGALESAGLPVRRLALD